MAYIKGSKGGESSQGTSEDPNTLKSNSVFKVIDVLGEGPIGGLRDGYKSVLLNGTPVQNKDGSYNFKGVHIEERRGLPDQPHVEGFSELESDYAVGVDVLKSSPVVRTIRNLEADAARITLVFKQMTTVDGNSIHGASVDIAIDVQPSDGVWQEAKRDTVNGKSPSQYPRQYRVSLPGKGPWNIRVRRLTDDSQTTSRQDAFQWQSYTEIIEGKFTWPGIAYIAMTIDAKLFGSSLPSRAYDVIPQLVSVPSNYDAEARTYSSTFWDGTFKTAATDNPAWHAYHLATEKMGAVGTDKYDVYEIAKYCDELVSDGYGGKIPRFSIDTVFTSARPVQEALSDVCSSFRGSFYWTGSAIKFVYDAPEPVSRYFGISNVLDGGFAVQSSADNTRFNVVNVTFNDPDNNFATAIETVVDVESLKKQGEWIQKDVVMFGQTNRARAHMHGRSILYSDRKEVHRISFRPSVSDLDIRPGQVIGTSDPKRAGESLSGRISVYTPGARKIVLDQPVSGRAIASGTWQIAVRMPNGGWDKLACSFESSTVVKIDRDLIDVPVEFAAWVLIGQKAAPEQWRVIGVSDATTADGHPCFQVDAVEFHPGKYAEIEQGIIIDDDPTSLLPSGAISPPTGLAITASTRVAGSQEVQNITFSWTPSEDPRADYYVVAVKAPGEQSYRPVSETQANYIELEDGTVGEWEFRVYARGGLGIASAWAYKKATIGSLLMPLAPDSVNATEGNRSVSLFAILSSSIGQEFEFWISDAEVADVEHNGRLVGVGRSAAVEGLKPGTVYYFHVRGVNVHGKSGWYNLQSKTTYDFNEEMQAINKEAQREDGPIGQAIKNNSEAISKRVDDALGEFGRQLPEKVELTLKPLEDRVSVIDSNFAKYKESRQAAEEASAAQIELIKAQAATNKAAIEQASIATVAGDAVNSAAITKVEAKSDQAAASIRQTMDATVENNNRALANLGSQLNANVDGVRTEYRQAIQSESEAREKGQASVRSELRTELGDYKAEEAQRQLVQVAKDQVTRLLAYAAWAHSETGKAGTAYESVSSATKNTTSSMQELTVKSELGDLSAEVNQRITTEVDSIARKQKAMYTLAVGAYGNRPAVFGMESNGSVSEVRFLTNSFTISDGDRDITPFIVKDGLVHLGQVMIGSGNVYGYLESVGYGNGRGFKIDFQNDYLEARNGKFRGEVEATSFIARSTKDGGRMEMTETGIRIYDPNGRLRVEMGIF